MTLDELERLARAAQLGPWYEEKGLAGPFDNDDRAYIAAVSPDVVLDLIAQVRAAARPADGEEGLREALRRSTAMAHATGEKFWHRDSNRKRGLDPDDWTVCDAPLCAQAVAALADKGSREAEHTSPLTPITMDFGSGHDWTAWRCPDCGAVGRIDSGVADKGSREASEA